jgi:methionyl-tRNA formyltransferase
MRVLIMANWGIGREVLNALLEYPQTTIDRVITNSEACTKDPWRNAVADLARVKGLKIDHGRVWHYSQLAEYLKENIDLLVTHGWPQILPTDVYSAPSLGSINIHPSLLPKYRGPAPHQHVFINRDRRTGLTCHEIDAGVDAGPIIAQLSVPLSGNESLSQLIDLQKPLVKPLVHKALNRLADPNFKPEIQNDSMATYAPKLRKAL